MSSQAVAIEVTARQRVIVQALARAPLSSQQLAERCRIILRSAQGQRNELQARELEVGPQRIRRWRRRWAAAQARLAQAEQSGVADKELERMIIAVLADAPRSGAPAKFSPEQVASIIALACELPADSELPLSHWTPAELSAQAQKRGIVESISPRQLDRFLARCGFGRTSGSTG
jgi:putative transposase